MGQGTGKLNKEQRSGIRNSSNKKRKRGVGQGTGALNKEQKSGTGNRTLNKTRNRGMGHAT